MSCNVDSAIGIDVCRKPVVCVTTSRRFTTTGVGTVAPGDGPGFGESEPQLAAPSATRHPAAVARSARPIRISASCIRFLARAAATRDGDNRFALFGANTRHDVRFIAPARELIHPVDLVLETQPPERLHERHALAIAVGDTRAEVDVWFSPGLLPHPSARIRDEAASLVLLARRERADGFDERGVPCAAGRCVARAI